MSRTAKTEYHGRDGFHESARLARKARQPQRDRDAFQSDIVSDDGEGDGYEFFGAQA